MRYQYYGLSRGPKPTRFVSSFEKDGISFPEHADVSDLVQRYLEIRIRRIKPVPRRVHFSEEIHDSLGELVRNDEPNQKAQAMEAWRTVFYLNDLFGNGLCVQSFQSKMKRRKGPVNDTETTDLLLWDYGMHHLHLSRHVDGDGFVLELEGSAPVCGGTLRVGAEPEQLSELSRVEHGTGSAPAGVCAEATQEAVAQSGPSAAGSLCGGVCGFDGGGPTDWRQDILR